MSLGLTPRQVGLFRSTAGFCDGLVPESSVYGLLHRECHRLFPDEAFADLFTDVGRQVAKAAGLVGRRRVLDSTPLYDAVARMDPSRWSVWRSVGC